MTKSGIGRYINFALISKNFPQTSTVQPLKENLVRLLEWEYELEKEKLRFCAFGLNKWNLKYWIKYRFYPVKSRSHFFKPKLEELDENK